MIGASASASGDSGRDSERRGVRRRQRPMLPAFGLSLNAGPAGFDPGLHPRSPRRRAPLPPPRGGGMSGRPHRGGGGLLKQVEQGVSNGPAALHARASHLHHWPRGRRREGVEWIRSQQGANVDNKGPITTTWTTRGQAAVQRTTQPGASQHNKGPKAHNTTRGQAAHSTRDQPGRGNRKPAPSSPPGRRRRRRSRRRRAAVQKRQQWASPWCCVVSQRRQWRQWRRQRRRVTSPGSGRRDWVGCASSGRHGWMGGSWPWVDEVCPGHGWMGCVGSGPPHGSLARSGQPVEAWARWCGLRDGG